MSSIRTSRTRVTLVSLTLLVALVAPAAGQKIKMATLSPDGSPWDTILEKMGSSWEQATDGRVTLTILPGGVAGDEPDIIRKMKIGQYQGGALSVAGLSDIHKDFTVFQIPLFFDDYPELMHVLRELTPALDQQLEAQGYKRLAWGYVGWVYFFTSKEARTVADMQKLKIFTWAGDETLVQWWRRNGFKPVALAATDIMTGLQTGLIEAISVPPLYAMQTQYYKRAPYMADLGLAPLIGAVLLDQRAWKRMRPEDQAAVLAAGREAESRVLEQIPKLDEGAIKLMQTAGLEVVAIRDSPNSQEWIRAAEGFADDMRGDIVPAGIFDKARASRDAYRKQSVSGPSSAP
ncbi:MAG TPA: TRAP transporter substrate-binding protein DctP [Thermoanaerobaculia bacterium]|nr:TRAP transporter substrate-binding protein DctP [Thermoanaerobaculia bacterium]